MTTSYEEDDEVDLDFQSNDDNDGINYTEEMGELYDFMSEVYGAEGTAGALTGALMTTPMGIPIYGAAVGASVGSIVNLERNTRSEFDDRDYSLGEIGVMSALQGSAIGTAAIAQKYGGEAVDIVTSTAGSAKEIAAETAAKGSRTATDAATSAGDYALQVGADAAANADEAGMATVVGLGTAFAGLMAGGLTLGKVNDLLESDDGRDKVEI